MSSYAFTSGWKKIDHGLELEVTIPSNTTAKVLIPFHVGINLLLNGKKLTNNTEVKMIKIKDKNIILEIVQGSYHFQTQH